MEESTNTPSNTPNTPSAAPAEPPASATGMSATAPLIAPAPVPAPPLVTPAVAAPVPRVPVAFTFVCATPHQQVYAWSGSAAGRLPKAVLVANAAPGPLGPILSDLTVATDDEAILALIAGVGTAVQATLVWSSGATAAPRLTVTKDLSLVVDVAAKGSGFLFITHRWSPLR